MKTVGCGLALCFAAALLRAEPPAPVRLAPFGVSQAPGAIAVWNGLAFFAGNSQEAGVELWKSDGTPAGTALITDFIPGSGTAAATPGEVTPFDHGVAFACTLSGRRLCASDGTVAGTRPFGNVTPQGTNLTPVHLAALGDLVFYEGTSIADGPFGPIGIGSEPFRTHALTATTMAWDIWSLLPAASSSPTNFVPVGNRMFFTAFDNDLIFPLTIYGRELWIVDGDDAHGVADISHVSGMSDQSSNPSHLTAVGSRLLFAADDLVLGRELWATDGTEAGTVRVRDIRPGQESSIAAFGSNQNTPKGSTAVLGDRMLFAADDGATGAEPWISDGTEAGTLLLADVNPGTAGSAPAGFTRVGNRVFFHADDGADGRELWVTDGTLEGTHLVEDVAPGVAGSSPVDPVAVGSVLVYQASDPEHGQELWVSDGSADGTFLLADLEPGPGSSNPQGIAANSAYVFFAAQTTAAPRSLYSLSRGALRVGLGFHPLSPCRVFDSRNGSPLSNGLPQTVGLAGACGVPPGAGAVAANLTAIAPTGAGFLRAYPSGTAPPNVSQANFEAGQTRTNNAILEIGADGKVAVEGGWTSGAVDFVLDVVGYFE